MCVHVNIKYNFLRQSYEAAVTKSTERELFKVYMNHMTNQIFGPQLSQLSFYGYMAIYSPC